MKQKIATRAIIKKGDKLLLLRRRGGRPSISGLYELPGGRVHINQQPEDAIRHALHIHIGASAETVQLTDTMTFIDPDDRELQYLFLIYDASLRPTDDTLQLSEEYDKYVWKKMTDIQREDLTQSTQQMLDITEVPFGSVAEKSTYSDDIHLRSSSIVLYTDGGSRGNPGPAAAAYVALDLNGGLIREGGSYLGVCDSVAAEYNGIYLGLECALEVGARLVDVRIDAQTVVDQLIGRLDPQRGDIIALRRRILELAHQFDKVTYSHVNREHNALADGLVNKILDSNEEKLSTTL